jgi:hypothetical protein
MAVHGSGSKLIVIVDCTPLGDMQVVHEDEEQTNINFFSILSLHKQMVSSLLCSERKIRERIWARAKAKGENAAIVLNDDATGS